MAFCRDFIDMQEDYNILPETVLFDGYTFSAQLSNNKLVMRLYKMKSGGFRFRVEPIEPEKNYKRYDLSKEPLILEQDALNSFSKLEIKQEDNYFYLYDEDDSANIFLSPFSITFRHEERPRVIINSRHQLVFNHHDNSYREEEHNGFVDKITTGVNAVGIDFLFQPNVKFSGFHERAMPLNLPDNTYHLYNVDALGWDKGRNVNIYGNIPALQAHLPIGSTQIFWSNPSDTFAKISSGDDGRCVRFISEGGYIDCFIYMGKPKEVISSYTQFVGRPLFAPMFTLGYQQCRWGYRTQSDVEYVMKKLDQAHFPYDVFWLDLDHLKDNSPFAFNREAFPRPESLIKSLADKHRYMVRLSDCHLPEWRLREVDRFSMKNPDGSTFFGSCWPGKSIWPDFLNPAARSWWASMYDYSKDIAGPNVFFWNDMNEPTIFDSDQKTFPKSLVHFGGYEDREVHNLYGLLNNAATYSGLIDRNGERSLRPWVLTRSFFAGSQKYAWSWTGDNYGNWDHLEVSLSMVMAGGICGMPFIGADVGGFFGSASPLLLTRWFQLAAVSYPFFREHCIHNADRREPYLFDSQYLSAMRNAVNMRYRLIGYWYTAMRRTVDCGVPIIRPLWMEFPDEMEMHDVDSQVMIDSCLMAAPVVREDGVRQIVKPPGIWYSYSTGKQLKSSIQIQCKLDDVPVFIRGGSIIPEFVEAKPTVYETVHSNKLQLIIVPDENGMATGELYLDDGNTFDYQHGVFMQRFFMYYQRKITCSGTETLKEYANIMVSKVIIMENGTKKGISINKKLSEDFEFEF